jgi:RNA polymerase sigma factor (sigma-70 family)
VRGAQTIAAEVRVVRVPETGDALDRDLVARIAGGDEDAFRRLFARYAPTAKALAGRVVRQSSLAEEIVQEALLAVWKHPDGYDPARGSVKSWFLSMVHHRAVDTVRREASQRRRADDLASDRREDVDDPAQDVVDAVDLPEIRRRVREALGELPEDQRRVLESMYLDGLTQRQIAERWDLPLGTVKSRTLLGMRKMRTALEGLER